MFNPTGRGGAVVVDQTARRILHHFDRPATIEGPPGEAGAEFEAVARRLAELDVIRAVGTPTRPEFQDGSVLTAWLHVTNECNLRCPYCYLNKTPEGMDEATGRAAVASVFRSARRHDFRAVKLKYAGGEASLNKRLMSALHAQARALAAESGITLYATLLSNGVALSPGFIAALRTEGIKVMISLDGTGGHHDVQRPLRNGGPSFALVERTIARMIEQDHAPHLSITITNRNAAGVADVVRFALERGLTFSLNFFRDNDCAAGYADLRYEQDTMISAVRGAFAVIEELLPPWSVLGAVLDRGQLLEPRLRSCGVGRDYVVIDQRGRVAKCHMEIERTLGDVLTADPLELVRGDRSSVLNLSVEQKEGCRDCTWRYWCSGGCAVATFRATGRYDVRSPNCEIYRAVYPEALRLEGLRLLRYAPQGAPTGAPRATNAAG